MCEHCHKKDNSPHLINAAFVWVSFVIVFMTIATTYGVYSAAPESQYENVIVGKKIAQVYPYAQILSYTSMETTSTAKSTQDVSAASASESAPANVTLFPFYISDLANTPSNTAYPSTADELIGSFKMTNIGTSTLTFGSVDIVLKSSENYSGKITVWQNVSSTLAPSWIDKTKQENVANFKQLSSGNAQIKVIGAATSTPAKFVATKIKFSLPVNKIVIKPNASETFTLTGGGFDKLNYNASSTPPGAQIMAFVESINWYAFDTKGKPIRNKQFITKLNLPLKSIVFKPLKVKILLAANTPQGASSAGADQQVLKFNISNSLNPDGKLISVDGITIWLNSNIKFSSDRKIKIYDGESLTAANLLFDGYVSDLKKSPNTTKFLKFQKSVLIEMGTQKMLTVTISTVDAKANNKLQISVKNVAWGDNSIPGDFIIDKNLALIGKMLTY